MKRPREIYHGSSLERIKTFEPKKPKDLGKNKCNKYKGVYATDNKQWAKIMRILSGVKNGTTSIFTEKNKTIGVVHRGKITKKYFYVYTFDSKNFKNIPRNSHQYICFERIKPQKVEKFLVKDYLKYIRYLK